jgi:hypothetical protein
MSSNIISFLSAVYDDGLTLPCEQQQLEQVAAELRPLLDGLPLAGGKLAVQTTGACRGVGCHTVW